MPDIQGALTFYAAGTAGESIVASSLFQKSAPLCILHESFSSWGMWNMSPMRKSAVGYKQSQYSDEMVGNSFGLPFSARGNVMAFSR